MLTLPDPVELAKVRQEFEAGRLDRDQLRAPFMRVGQMLRQVQASLEGSAISEIRMRSEGLVLALESGVLMHWEPEDIGTATSISFSHGAYEPEELALMTSLARGKSCFLDVGANIGWFSLHLARVLNAPQAKIYAFEPVATSAEALRRNVSLNGLDAVVTVIESGVGDVEGEIEFHVPTPVVGAASMKALHPGLPATVQTCRVTTLDTFANAFSPPRIDLVKCDVEGAELMVVRGGLDLIARDRPLMMFELLRKWSRAFGYHPNAVIDLLSPLGYDCWAIGKGAPRPILSIEEETEETNFLFLAPEHVQERQYLEGLSVR